MTDREIMQQALEALEAASDIVENYTRAGYEGEFNEAITALRERLAQPEQEPVGWFDADSNSVQWKDGLRNCDLADRQPFYTAQQPQMQPCAGRNCGSINPNLHSAECFEDYEKATGLAQPEQPEQEPVAWVLPKMHPVMELRAQRGFRVR